MVVKKKTHNNRLKLRSKKYNKTHNKKKQLKKTKKQNGNNIQLGGGNDIDIYYKTGLLQKDIKPIKIGETDTNYSAEPVPIPYKKLHDLPLIKVKTNGKYKLEFFCKPYSSSSSSTTSTSHTRSLRSSEIPFATYIVTRSGTIFHSQHGNKSNNKLEYIKSNFADKNIQAAVTIIIKIFKEEETKNASGIKTTSYKFLDKQYFNLKPVE
jgi:hypothetical protein